MAPSMKVLGVACALGLPAAVRAVAGDVSALVQTGVRGPAARNQWSAVLGDFVSMAEEEQANQAKEVGGQGVLQMMQDPENEKPPIWHGVLFEREVLQVEKGTSAQLIFDHGCSKRDEYGDNFCEFPHGDSIHVKFQFYLEKPINDGYFTISGKPRMQGIAGFLKNGELGRKMQLTAKLDDVTVECPICGGTCEPEIFGKQRKFQLPDCPLPAHQNVTLGDIDIELPWGRFLPLIQMKMQSEVVVTRMEGEASSIVSHTKMLGQMGRIYHGMPRMM